MTEISFKALNTSDTSYSLLCWLSKQSNQHKKLLCFGLQIYLQPLTETTQCSGWKGSTEAQRAYLLIIMAVKSLTFLLCSLEKGNVHHIFVQQTAECNWESKAESTGTNGTSCSVGSRTQPVFLWLCVLWLDCFLCKKV